MPRATPFLIGLFLLLILSVTSAFAQERQLQPLPAVPSQQALDDVQEDEGNLPQGQFLNVPTLPQRLAPRRAATETALLSEDFETDAPDWDPDGDWEVGAPAVGPPGGYNSSNLAGTDLEGPYDNYGDEVIYSPTISLEDVPPNAEITLRFAEWYELESGHDYGNVWVTTDFGDNWVRLSRRSGAGDWRITEIDLSEFAGQEIVIAFQLVSDEEVTGAGWYIDAVEVTRSEPQPLSAEISSLNSQNFPNIYANVTVDTLGTGFPDLTQDNFAVYEKGVLQTELFNVSPPEQSGGVRLVDVVFLMDNSGSMGNEQAAVQENVFDFVNTLVASDVDFALGLARYGASQNSGDPILEDGGSLTSDATYFKNDVWARNETDGGTEPGYYATTESAGGFAFRPGAQRIFIIITDETPDQGGATLNDAYAALQDGGIRLFALTETSLYDEFQFLTSATEGQTFNIFSPFTDILDTIAEQVSSTYVVSYRSSNPNLDGTERTVRVEVTYDRNTANAEASYVPGAAPSIQRAAETIALGDEGRAQGTPLTIEAEITDDVAPGVESATLFYKQTPDPESAYTSVEMTNTSGNVYQAEIPGRAVVTPGMDYYITATDGQTTSSSPSTNPGADPYNIAILPNEPPSITHTPVTEATAAEPIDVAFTATDATNELDRVQLYFRRAGQLNYEVETFDSFVNQSDFLLTIPDSVVTTDGVEYYIEATDDLGISSTSGTADNPHVVTTAMPSFGTTIITHGLSFPPCFGRLELSFADEVCRDDGLEADQNWTIAMAEAVAQRYEAGRVYIIKDGILPEGPFFSSGPGGETVIVFDWLEESSEAVEGYAEAAADVLAARLIDGALQGSPKWSLNQLHFIGHSRGTVVLSEAIQRLGFYTETRDMLPENLDIDPEIHFTTLDAHPWDRSIIDDVGDTGPVSASDHKVNAISNGGVFRLGDNDGVVCWKNVAYLDNFWHQTARSYGDILRLGGFFEALKDLNGMPEFVGCEAADPDGKLNYDLSHKANMSHNGVRAWYYGTIDLNAGNDGSNTEPVSIRNEWYDLPRGAVGFNISRTAGADIDMLVTDPTVRVDYAQDETLSSRDIFNGDFKVYRGRPELWGYHLPGWGMQGGNGEAQARRYFFNFSDFSENPTLMLRGETAYRRHNPFYIPAGASTLEFRLRVKKESSSHDLSVLMGSTPETLQEIKTFSLTASSRGFFTKKIPMYQYSGSVQMLEFRIEGSGGETPEVFIDDVGFGPQTYLFAAVAPSEAGGTNRISSRRSSNSNGASPLVQLHVYDARGNHTGATSDSTWVEEIPGSRYFPADSSRHGAIKLSRPTGKNTYTFQFESQGGNGLVRFQLDDVRDDDRTVTALFDDVGITSGTVASATLQEVNPSLNLEIDANGDGQTNEIVEPATYIEEYILKAQAEPNGKISPEGANIANRGDSLIFHITPDDGYQVADILVDSVSVGAVSSLAFEDISGDHTIRAVFEEKAAPLVFSLSQNHPNPFTHTTTIAYALPEAQHVTLEVFDTLGRKITTLVDERKEAGEHDVTFDAEGLASGVYLYRLTAGRHTETGTMVLIR